MRDGPSIISARLPDISGSLPSPGRAGMSIPALCGPLSHQHRASVEKVPRACRGPYLSDMSAIFET
jgi:hypothetical protein